MSSAPPSSTPTRADNAIFSDEVTRQRGSSPPSSPPGFPWELEKASQSIAEKSANLPSSPIKKNAFSVLGKRNAFDSISDNARPSKQRKPTKPSNSKPLTQMQMSLGQDVQKKCKQCGMEYVASSAEDRKLHDKFHKQNTEGYDVGKTFVSKTTETKWRLFKGVKEGDVIVMVDCMDNHHRRKRGQAILDIVQRELGAVPIPEDDIWDDKTQQNSGIDPGLNETLYKSFLYVRGTKCVGFVLVQRIQDAFRVQRPKDAPAESRPEETAAMGTKTALEALHARRAAAEAARAALAQSIIDADAHPIELSSTKSPAILGISRIWSSPMHRSEGIARKLLDTAIGEYNQRQAGDALLCKGFQEDVAKETDPAHKEAMSVLTTLHGNMKKIEKKDQVAFSQPTEAGARLARRWFARPYGWSVYID